MRNHPLLYALAAAGFLDVAPHLASAQTAAAYDGPVDASAHRGESPAMPPENTRVRDVTESKGFIFHPSTPPVSAFRFAVGGLYDAVDPQVMYGIELRIPQVTLDARLGLGAGWSAKGHLNSMFVANELLLGASYGGHLGRWSLEGTASAGVYFGKLAQFSFDAAMVSPEYRPELAVGYDLGDIALSVRGAVLLMGPERARVGEIWAGLDNSNLFVGHSETIYVENPTKSAGVWYFGLGAMTTRAYYQFWVLFPDSPALFTYARTVAGYEF